MTHTNLVGMFFMRDYGETHSCGEIVGSLSANHYLLKVDRIDRVPVSPPMEVMHLDDMADVSISGYPAVMLFTTREELDAWHEWLDTPSEPRVVSLVKPVKDAT
jgi:hypothetical protein